MRFLLRCCSVLVVCLAVLLCLVYAQAQNTTQSAAPADENVPKTNEVPASTGAELTIPGPLRSFLRMAGISQKASPDEVLPLLARNIYVQGYVGWSDSGNPTEFLTLLGRYVNQARELSALAGPTGTIHVSSCEEATPLLRILGYRLRQACGQGSAILITADPERAFLTTDSGFPLLALEEALQHGKPFSYGFPASHVPVLFSQSDWTSLTKAGPGGSSDLLEAMIHHPLLARLYWAISRTDAATRMELKQTVGLKKLLPFSPVMDYYGTQICIRGGRVQVP